jgi:hypothetical protein
VRRLLVAMTISGRSIDRTNVGSLLVAMTISGRSIAWKGFGRKLFFFYSAVLS